MYIISELVLYLYIYIYGHIIIMAGDSKDPRKNDPNKIPSNQPPPGIKFDKN